MRIIICNPKHTPDCLMLTRRLQILASCISFVPTKARENYAPMYNVTPYPWFESMRVLIFG